MPERFDFTGPIADYPTADNMLFDTVPINELTPEQAINALLIAGRVVRQPRTLNDFLVELKARQDRFNRAWTLVIALVFLTLGMWLGATYI